jgi:hypothetical protein
LALFLAIGVEARPALKTLLVHLKHELVNQRLGLLLGLSNFEGLLLFFSEEVVDCKHSVIDCVHVHLVFIVLVLKLKSVLHKVEFNQSADNLLGSFLFRSDLVA